MADDNSDTILGVALCADKEFVRGGKQVQEKSP